MSRPPLLYASFWEQTSDAVCALMSTITLTAMHCFVLNISAPFFPLVDALRPASDRAMLPAACGATRKEKRS
jgi:hypothetical protein